MTDYVGAFGYGHGYGYGGAPYAGLHPADLTSSDVGQGFDAMLANDRHQVIAMIRKGAPGIAPALRHWYGGPVEWAEIIGARSRGQLVHRYATDEDDDIVVGVIELPMLAIAKGNEATVEAVLIEVEFRPALIGNFDGGIDPTAMLGFDAYVEGWRSPRISEDTTSGKSRQVIRSDVISYEIGAATIDSSYFPARYTALLQTRLGAHVRAVRVGLSNFRGCELVSVEVYGAPQPSSIG